MDSSSLIELVRRHLPGGVAPGPVPLRAALAARLTDPQVSRNTAARALRLLRDEGWVVTQQGWGSFVRTAHQSAASPRLAPSGRGAEP